MIRFIKKIFPLLFVLALLGLGWYYQDWVKEQYRHAKGVYYIYKGDQAYSKDNMAKTLEFYKKGLALYPAHYEASAVRLQTHRFPLLLSFFLCVRINSQLNKLQ